MHSDTLGGPCYPRGRSWSQGLEEPFWGGRTQFFR
jgi:hypothetical protein